MIPHLVPEIEGGYPERDGEEGEGGGEGEGLILEYSRSWMSISKCHNLCCQLTFKVHFILNEGQNEHRGRSHRIVFGRTAFKSPKGQFMTQNQKGKLLILEQLNNDHDHTGCFSFNWPPPVQYRKENRPTSQSEAFSDEEFHGTAAPVD